jgi:hypothetical protein
MASSEPAARKLSLSDRISLAFRPKSSAEKLRKRTDPSTLHQLPANLERNPEGRRLQTGAVYRSTSLDNVDEQTGERRDDTELLHGLAHNESNDSLDRIVQSEDLRPPGDAHIASLPAPLWNLIAGYLEVADVASLTFASKTLFARLGPGAWEALRGEEGKSQRITFLSYLDEAMPGHLLCILCGIYHVRTKIGDERLRPNSVLNPLFACPSVGKPGMTAPRARLTPGYSLPFTFVQLVMRAHRFSPNHGIPSNALERRYKDPDSEWSHQTRFYIHKDHLLVRVVSKSFALPNLPQSGLRHLLYSRGDYSPYFSVCQHWRDGDLMPVAKCALSHIPERRLTVAQQLKSGPSIQLARMNPSAIVSLCSFCRPMRRCPECPTEYLVELKLGEDKFEVDPSMKFKQIIVVTRWSDLGDGRTPRAEGGEWNSVVGDVEDGVEHEPLPLYKSFDRMGKRAISGTFEAQSGVALPGQRLLSLNPKMQKRGEEGDDWY